MHGGFRVWVQGLGQTLGLKDDADVVRDLHLMYRGKIGLINTPPPLNRDYSRDPNI